MRRSASRRALRGTVGAAGVVATAAGLDTMLRGARTVAGEGPANAALESELRFYAAFYVAYGLVALRVAPRADRDGAAVRGLAGALFLAGLARAGSWATVGRPHRLQLALLALELGGPPPVAAWQARLAR